MATLTQLHFHQAFNLGIQIPDIEIGTDLLMVSCIKTIYDYRLCCANGQQKSWKYEFLMKSFSILVVTSPISLFVPVQTVFIEFDHHLHNVQSVHSTQHCATHITQDTT